MYFPLDVISPLIAITPIHLRLLQSEPCPYSSTSLTNSLRFVHVREKMVDEGDSAHTPPLPNPVLLHTQNQTQMQAQVETQPQAQTRPRKRRRPPVRRKTVRWSQREVDALLAGVRAHGVGKWAAILRHSQVFNGVRTSVDLKDKWRNLTSPVRAAALAASSTNSAPIMSAQTCSAATPSSVAPVPIVSNPTAAASLPDVSMADPSADAHPTIMDLDNFGPLSQTPLDAQNPLDFDDTVNMSSPNSSSPELCLPQPQIASEARTPLPNPPSESSVSPELLADTPALNYKAVRPSSSLQAPASCPSQQADANQVAQAQTQGVPSPSGAPQHVQTPVIPAQHQASVQSALHRTLAQSSALVEYWRTLAAHPTLCRHAPASSNSQSVVSYLFGNDDDDDDDDDDEVGEGERRTPVGSFPFGHFPFPPNLGSAPVVPISQGSPTGDTGSQQIGNESMLQQQWASQAQLYNSYLAAYSASQIAQQGQNLTHPYLSLAAGTLGVDNSNEARVSNGTQVLGERLEQQAQDDSGTQSVPQVQPHVDPQLLMQVLRNITPGDFQS